MTVATWSTAAVWALFTLSAALVWIAGAPLARLTDALSLQLGLGEALGGLLLLAIATNLPEVAIVLSAAVRGDLSMAVGNVLGGIAVQTLVLIVIDRWGVRAGAPLATRAATPGVQIEALLVIAMMAATTLGALSVAGPRFGTLSVGDLIVPAVWIAGVALLAKMRPRGPPVDPAARKTRGRAGAMFAAASLATLVGGVGLEAAGSALAVRIGWEGALFGATVLAAVTSLPEITTGIAAARQDEHELAASDILGGNAFLPVLLTAASLVAGASAFASIGPDLIVLCATGALMTAVFAAALAARPQRRTLGVGPEAFPMLAIYGLGLILFVSISQQTG